MSTSIVTKYSNLAKPFTAVLAVIVSLSTFGVSRAANLSVGMPYAWFDHSPGQSADVGPHYRDDIGNAGGLHSVHLSGGNNFGVFSLGELTDGATAASVVGGAGQQVLAQHDDAAAAKIVFDLGGVFNVENVVIGALVSAGGNNNAPDDVSISFSTVAPGGPFSVPEFFDLEALYGPLGDGHTDLLADVTDTLARYVMLDFDGGSMAEPGGSDPDEKWSVDEITINGAPLPVPEPSSLLLAAFGLFGLSVCRRRRR